MTRTDAFYESAILYNSKKRLPIPPIFSEAEPESRLYADVVATYQEGNDLLVDGKLGPSTLTAMRDELREGAEPKVLDYEDLVDLAEFTQPFEGEYWSCNRDGEYEGLFDRPPEKYHWASKNKPGSVGTHVGLSFGYIQFTQDGGALGKLLKKMHKKDPALFADVFGEHHEELLEVTTRTSNTRKSHPSGKRRSRVHPVGGHDLWRDYWVQRFRKAGREPVFQRCQVEMAVDDYMMPALRSCDKLDLESARAVVIVFDRGVQYGPTGAFKKLLQPNRVDSDSEHTFLRKFMHHYSHQRWGHRVEKLWEHADLWDGPCVWDHLL